MASDSDQQGEPDWWDKIEKAERSDLQVDSDAHREYMKIIRDRWDGPKGAWFEVRDVPWPKKQEILSDCIDISDSGGADMALNDYYNDMLEYMITDSSVDFSNPVTLLRGLNDESGEKLKNLVPEPGTDDLAEAEEGKSDEPYEEPAQASS